MNDIPRDRWSRPLVVPPEGGKAVAYTRATTFVDALEDKFNLQAWQQRMVAAGLAQRQDLQLRAASLGPQPDDEARVRGWKRDMDQLCTDAREAAAASAAATIGTSLHALTERLDRGLDVGVVPEQYRPHLKAYEAATAKLEAVHIEVFTVLDELRIGGTPDRIVKVEGEEGLIVADLKTGKSSVQYGAGKIAQQIAVYAHSQLYSVDDSGQPRRTAVEGLRTDKGIVIALDAKTGQCDMHWIDLTEAWQAVDLCRQVRQWRSKKSADFLSPMAVGAPVKAAAPTYTDEAITAAINAATSADELAQIWRASHAKGVWDDSHTAAASARKQALTQQTTAA